MLSTFLLTAWDYLREIAEIVVLGFVVAGVINAVVNKDVVARYLGGSLIGANLLGALIGIVTPLCCCSAIPTAITLYRAGSRRGPACAFLIATPWFNWYGLTALAIFLGPQTALAVAGSAVVIAVGTGVAIDLGESRAGVLPLTSIGPGTLVPSPDSVFSTGRTGAERTLTPTARTSVSDPFTAGPDVLLTSDEEGKCACGESGKGSDGRIVGGSVHPVPNCNCCPSGENENGLTTERLFNFTDPRGKLRAGIQFALDELRELGPWMFAGVVLGAAIETVVPERFFTQYLGGTSLLGLLAALVVAGIFSADSLGSLPWVQSLLSKGLGAGSAMILLVAGVGTNVSTLGPIAHVMGRRTAILYGVSVVLLAGIFGYSLNLLH